MRKKLFLLGCFVYSMTTVGQVNKHDSKTENWYFRIGASYFAQVAGTELPLVGGNAPLRKIYEGGKLVSEENLTRFFGEGFRTGINGGYRFNTRFGAEIAGNYYFTTNKTMAQTTTDRIFVSNGKPVYNFKSVGQRKAFDLVPTVVLYLGEYKGLEPFSKLGVIVPIYGDFNITTDAVVPTGMANPATVAIHSVDKASANPTVGFMAALGTSYRLGKSISVFAELEYRNISVHGKSKETIEFTKNGQDALSTRTTAEIYTNYVDRLDVNSNNSRTNPNGVDSTKPTDELSSYVGISAVGLTLGLKYNL